MLARVWFQDKELKVFSKFPISVWVCASDQTHRPEQLFLEKGGWEGSWILCPVREIDVFAGLQCLWLPAELQIACLTEKPNLAANV